MNNKAFTLVELIVVITILSILGTIAFVSLQGYSSSARDSIRLTDLQNIEKGLEFMSLKSGRVPIPDDKVDISASGTVISYQGYAGKNVLSQIGISNGGLDPLDQTYYTYATNAGLNKYQLLGYLESGTEITLSGLNQVHADLNNRYPFIKGNPIGIIVDASNNEPLQMTGTGIDIVTASNNFISYYGNSSGSKLVFTNDNRITIAQPTSSCKSLYETGIGRSDGVYSINPKGKFFDVYCDMTTEGGGWTLFYANNGNADSQIKKSFVQMRSEVLGSGENFYELSDYNYENLAGLLDYTIFTDLGHKEVLAANKDFLKSSNLWIKTEFNLPETLVWSFSDYILGTSHIPESHCLNIPNNGYFSMIASDGTQALNNFQVNNRWGNSFGVSSGSAPCNEYDTNLFSFGMFYSAGGTTDELRTRSPEHIGGVWTEDNQYRYFIR